MQGQCRGQTIGQACKQSSIGEHHSVWYQSTPPLWQCGMKTWHQCLYCSSCARFGCCRRPQPNLSPMTWSIQYQAMWAISVQIIRCMWRMCERICRANWLLVMLYNTRDFLNRRGMIRWCTERFIMDSTVLHSLYISPIGKSSERSCLPKPWTKAFTTEFLSS